MYIHLIHNNLIGQAWLTVIDSIVVVISVICALHSLRAHPLRARQPLSKPLLQFLCVLVKVAGEITLWDRRLAKVFANLCVTTSLGVFTVKSQRLQTAESSCITCPVLGVSFYHPSYSFQILATIVQEAVARVAVSSSTACLLIVALEGFGQSPVHDKAHIILVDAHTKRSGGYDNIVSLLIINPSIEGVLLDILGQLGVEWPRTDALSTKGSRQRLAFVSRYCVYNSWHVFDSLILLAQLTFARLSSSAVVHRLYPFEKVG